MEVLKDNLFNRIFRRRKLQEQHDEKIRLESTVKKIDLYMPKVQECEDLTKMLYLHREMWKEGIRNAYIGPNKYGFFRCKDIAEMSPEEVFLGNIYGLWTKTIPEWEKVKDHKFGVNLYGIEADTTIYQLMLYQYRFVLTSNMKLIRQQAVDRLKELKT